MIVEVALTSVDNVYVANLDVFNEVEFLLPSNIVATTDRATRSHIDGHNDLAESVIVNVVVVCTEVALQSI